MEFEILVDNNVAILDSELKEGTVTVNPMTTEKEDINGIVLLTEALDQAYEAGQQDYYDDLPSAQQLWEKLMEVIQVSA